MFGPIVTAAVVLTVVPPPAVTGGLARLAADDHAVRCRAQAAMEGPAGDTAAARLLVRLARAFATDPEARRRLGRLTALYAVRDVNDARDVVDRAFDDFPFLDAFDYDPAKKRYCPHGESVGLGRWVQRRFGHLPSSPHLEKPRRDTRQWADHRMATRQAAIELHAAGVPLWVLRLALREMDRRTRLYEASQHAYGSDTPAQ